MLSQISEKTLIPVGFVLVILTLGGWLVGYTSRVETSEMRITKLEERQQRYSEHQLQIYIQLSRIEGLLENDKTVRVGK